MYELKISVQITEIQQGYLEMLQFQIIDIYQMLNTNKHLNEDLPQMIYHELMTQLFNIHKYIQMLMMKVKKIK
jgi:hypothetical protein